MAENPNKRLPNVITLIAAKVNIVVFMLVPVVIYCGLSQYGQLIPVTVYIVKDFLKVCFQLHFRLQF